MKTGCSAACKRESEQPPCRAGILLRWSRRRDAVSWPGSPWSPWLLLSGSRLHRVEPGRVFLSAFCLRSASRAQAESRGVFPSLREPRRSRRPGRVEGTGFETIATLGEAPGSPKGAAADAGQTDLRFCVGARWENLRDGRPALEVPYFVGPESLKAGSADGRTLNTFEVFEPKAGGGL